MSRHTKSEYRKFLKTEFWIELSNRKKVAVGKCEECGGEEELHCHHTFYRANWFETKFEDLKVLCRDCHESEHGITRPMPCGRIMIHRDDLQFSRFIYWADYLHRRIICKSQPLNRREIWYLKMAKKSYPATRKDACMRFHVNNALDANKNWRPPMAKTAAEIADEKTHEQNPKSL